MDYIKAYESQLKDTWQVYFQAMIQMKADVWLYSMLDRAVVESTHLKPVQDLDTLVADLADKYGPDCRICVLPEGPQTIPYLLQK